MGKRDRPSTPPPDYTPQDRLQDALRAMGCPRPDKRHHRNQEDAQRHLDRVAATHPGHDHSAQVYRCPCQLGYVWGRRRTPPPPQ